MGSEKYDVLVVGGGPAGLRAAEVVSAAGRWTVLADHMPSVGRKFLVAGRGGLNLTHSEPLEKFRARYDGSSARWKSLLADFTPEDLRQWAHGLGVETFIGTSGRIFPTAKKAAPLLRKWMERLRSQNVRFRTRHRLVHFLRQASGDWEVAFDTPQGRTFVRTRVLILALGGASWPQTGSDAEWVSLLTKSGIAVTPFTPSNCGYEVDWPPEFLAKADGMPLKNIVVSAGGQSVRGELLITKYGLEGGALYQLGRALRTMEKLQIEIDLKPTSSHEELALKTDGTWRLSTVAAALMASKPPPASNTEKAVLAKSFPLVLRRPRPINEAISSAGGVSWDEFDEVLMLKRHPGIFCAGEMIDWDASTGGYLIQGCFSTATRAAQGALKFLTSPKIPNQNDLLQESLALRARYDEEPSHSDHVALLALQIFDGLESWHGLDARAREFLHSASLLHDIGWSQTPDGKGHHKWSAKLIREHAWKNLSVNEIEIVAQVARYHRKSPPETDHDEFCALKMAEQKSVMILGGILRIADALDRTHTGKVTQVVAAMTKNGILIQVRPNGIWNAERVTVETKSDMLQRASQRPVTCEELKS